MILGSGRIQPEAFVEFTPKELKKCKVGCVAVSVAKVVMKPFFGVSQLVFVNCRNLRL